MKNDKKGLPNDITDNQTDVRRKHYVISKHNIESM